MSDRGMKKWAPYKSLVEQSPHLLNMKKNKRKIERPLISSDLAEEINFILTNYKNQLLEIKYYEDGEIKKEETKIKKIDEYNKFLLLENKMKLLFKNILDIKIK